MGLFDKVKDAASQAVGQAQAGLDKAKHDLIAANRDEPAQPSLAGPQPILELVSHIDGKNAKVRLWPNRLEWERPRGLSAGKITAGALTGGMSLLATGVKGGKDEHDMVLLEHVTNVNSRKDGLMYYAVEVQTASGGAVNSITFRVSKDEAAQFRAAILDAMEELKARRDTRVVVEHAAPAAPDTGAPDIAGQLQRLASLRDAGILTDEEFGAKKAELLKRL
ncbi:SHOCT domain-containing protein [Microbacterium sp. KNMS]